MVKLLLDGATEPAAHPAELSSAGSAHSSNPSSSRIVASVTGKGCLAEVMPLEAVLSPGRAQQAQQGGMGCTCCARAVPACTARLRPARLHTTA